jgi:hypothetical protein
MNPISDNECDSRSQKPQVIAQSKSRTKDEQRLSYNSNILSYSSAEMIVNLPINSSRANGYLA